MLRAVPGTGLGLLRYDQPRSGSFGRLTAEARAKARDHQLLIITKANSRATVHRSTYLDYIGVKTFDDDGRGHGGAALPRPVHLRGLHRVGAAGADHRGEDRPGPGAVRLHRRQPLRQGPARGARDLPARRAVPDRRRRAVRHRDRGAAPAGAAQDPAVPAQGRVRPVHVLPRLHPPRPLHHRRAPARWRASCAPRSTAPASTTPRGSPSRCWPGCTSSSGSAQGQPIPDVDEAELQRLLVDATRTWDEDLAEAARSEYGEEAGARLVGLYGKAFPEAYKEDFSPRVAVVGPAPRRGAASTRTRSG